MGRGHSSVRLAFGDAIVVFIRLVMKIPFTFKKLHPAQTAEM